MTITDSGSEAPYGSMIRSSPFSGMLWQSKDGSAGNAGTSDGGSVKGKNAQRRNKGRMDVVISPVIFPVRDRDGDRTPTGSGRDTHGHGHGGHTPPHSKPPRKGSRKDKMLKRKSMMGAAAGRRHQQHYHHHGHHPNAKGRAAGSVQRPGFSGGAVPPLNL